MIIVKSAFLVLMYKMMRSILCNQNVVWQYCANAKRVYVNLNVLNRNVNYNSNRKYNFILNNRREESSSSCFNFIREKGYQKSCSSKKTSWKETSCNKTGWKETNYSQTSGHQTKGNGHKTSRKCSLFNLWFLYQNDIVLNTIQTQSYWK